MKFFFIMLAVILGANTYVFFRLWHIIPAYKPLTVIVAIALVSCFFLGLLGGFVGLPTNFVAFFYKIGTSWFIITFYCLMAFLLLDLLRFVLPMQKVLHNNWLTFIALAVSFTAVFSYGYFHYKNKEKVKLTLKIDKKITPLKIVALSDLHLGYGVGKTELEEWVKLINAENPDLVLMAGDIIDNHIKPLTEQNLAASLAKIKSHYGVFTCLGNHEYIGDSVKLSHSLDFLQKANISVLRDVAVLINNEFYIVGREDFGKKNRKPLTELLQNIDKTKPIILLDHKPFNLQETVENFVDLQFSGHTHEGQVFPANLLVKRIFELSHGYKKKENTHFYVSSGIGIWGGKFRIGTRSEYVIIELKN